MDETPYILENVTCYASVEHNLTSQINAFKLERVKLVDELVSAKEENQKMCMELQQLKIQFDKEHAQRTIQNDAYIKRLVEITNEKKLADQRIAQLTNENKLLVAQNKQLKLSFNGNIAPGMNTSTAQSGAEKYSSEKDGNFDVDDILKHRTYRGKRKFLVRWKGYSPDDDSWVAEEKLNCPDILSKYLKKRKLI